MVWFDPRHNVLGNQDATRVRIWSRGPTRARNRHYKTRAKDKWAQQGTHGPKGKVGGPTGRPADRLVGRPARGPHRLKLDTWRKLIGCLSRFAKDQLQNGLPLAVAPSYKYKGGGRETTHTHHTLSTHLSPLELEAFILDA